MIDILETLHKQMSSISFKNSYEQTFHLKIPPNTHTRVRARTHTHTHIYIYIYIYMSVSVCVCAYVCVEIVRESNSRSERVDHAPFN